MPALFSRMLLIMLLLVGVGEPSAAPQRAPETASAAQADQPAPRMIGRMDGTISNVFLTGTLAVAGEHGGPDSAAFNVIDVASPAHPRRLARVILKDELGHMQVTGTHLYIATKHAGPFYITLADYDLTDPRHPVLQRSYTFGDDRPIGAFQVVGDLVYSNVNGTFFIYDLQGSAAPTLVQTYPANGGGIQVIGTRAYVGNTDVYVYDVTDPRAATLLGRVPALGRPQVVGNLLYSVAEEVAVTDISDLGNPVELARIPLPGDGTTWSFNDFAVDDGLAYLAIGSGGVLVVDVSTANKPYIRAVYDTPGSGLAVRAAGGLAFVADGELGMSIVDVRPSGVPTERGSSTLSQEGVARTVRVAGSTAYVVDSELTWHGYPPIITATLRLLDTSDPAHMTQRGSYQARGDVRSLEVRENVVFLGYRMDPDSLKGGLDIVDVADPANPVLVGSYGQSSVTALQAIGQLLYLTDPYGLSVLDVSDPAHPQLLGSVTLSGVSLGMQIVQTTASIVTRNSMQIVDVSDPTHPRLRGALPIGGVGFNISIAVSGSMVYIGGKDRSVSIIDASDADMPHIVGNYAPARDVQQLVAVGKLVFATSLTYGMFIIDASEPTAPVLHSMFSAHPTQWLTVADSMAYYTNNENGSMLHAVDLSTAAPATPFGSYQTSSPSHLQVVGDRAYVTAWHGFSILDVSDATRPVRLGFYPGQTVALDVVGTIAYVGDFGGGLYLLDVSDPQHITLLSLTSTEQQPTAIVVRQGYAYISGFYGSFTIMDVRNPAAPTVVGRYDTAGANDVDVVGTTAYFVGGSALEIFDVSDPKQPKLRSSRDGWGGYRIRVSDGRAYIGAGKDGVRIIDVSNPTAPVNLSTIRTPSQAGEVGIVGTQAFVAAGSGFEVYDVSNLPATPLVTTAQAEREGYASEIRIVGNRVYVVDGLNGFLIFAYPSVEQTTIPAGGGTFTSSLNGTRYTFPDGAFGAAALLNYAACAASEMPSPGTLVVGDHCFDVTATGQADGQPVTPAMPYSVQVPLSAYERARAAADEVTWALYWWNGSAWVPEPSTLDIAAGTLAATPNHFSLWAVLGERIAVDPTPDPTMKRWVYLPLVGR